jgi:tRNA(adenine34) deaminase
VIKKIDSQTTKFMRAALAEAKKAGRLGEVPIGAVLVKDDKIIARAHNLTRTWRDPTAHAEIIVLQRASKKIKNERLTETSLFVTLEPCAMCAGAVVQARLKSVIFGALDPKAGACGSVFQVIPNEKLNHRPVVIEGVEGLAAGRLLTNFFKKRRKQKRSLK